MASHHSSVLANSGSMSKNHAPERENPVPDDLANLKLRGPHLCHAMSNRP